MKGFPEKQESLFVLTDLKNSNYESTKHFGNYWQHATC